MTGSHRSHPLPAQFDGRPGRRTLPVFGRGRPTRSDATSTSLELDEREFEGLVALLYQTLYRVAMRHCGYDSDQSNDFVQETMLRLWKARTNNPRGNVWTLPYARRTLVNVVIDDRRRHKRTPVFDNDTDIDQMPDETHCDWAMLVSDTTQRALDQLTERQRVVIEALVFHEMSPAEIANRLKLDRQSVYDYKRKALIKLASLFSVPDH